MAATAESASLCPVCDKAVSDSHRDAILCSRCLRWTHSECAGLAITKQNKPILKHENLHYLCEGCDVAARRHWATVRAGTRDTAAQTEAGVVRGVAVNREVQTEVCAVEAQTKTEEVRVVKEDKGVQCGAGGHTHNTRKPQVKKAVRKRAPIRVIGDSMVKRVGTVVQCTVDGSGVDSLSGARIDRVKAKVEERVASMDGGLVVIQGGGNGLEEVGEEETVSQVMDAVKAAEGRNLCVAVVGVVRRPREGTRYENLRRRTNARIHGEVLKLKLEWLRNKRGNLSFLDLDGALREGMDFAPDGVHLNESGTEQPI